MIHRECSREAHRLIMSDEVQDEMSAQRSRRNAVRAVRQAAKARTICNLCLRVLLAEFRGPR